MQSFPWPCYHVAAVDIKDCIFGHLVKLLNCSSMVEVFLDTKVLGLGIAYLKKMKEDSWSGQPQGNFSHLGEIKSDQTTATFLIDRK